MSKKKFKRWTDCEISLLKNNSYLPRDELQKIFPDRSIKSIIHKISNLGLPRKVYYERYSKEEDEFIINNNHLSAKEISMKLGNRSVESVIQRFNYLGLEWNKSWEFWTKDEMNVLDKCESIEEMKKHLPNRTKSQIYSQAKRLGKCFNDFWTDEELSILKDNYGKNKCLNL